MMPMTEMRWWHAVLILAVAWLIKHVRDIKAHLNGYTVTVEKDKEKGPD